MPTKAQFLNDWHANEGTATKLVVAVKLPTGATELIINTESIKSKVDYYSNAYNDELKLKNNNDIQIVGWLFA
jgi:hypothetical protein